MKISPILRITIGLLLLTLSLLLIADMIGVVPSQHKNKFELRKAIAESLAIQVSSQIGSTKIEQVLDAIVERNEEVSSIGLRAESGELELQTQGHDLTWKASDQTYSTITEILVPIFGQTGRWGTLEVKFKPLENYWQQTLKGQTLLSLLMFVFIAGAVGYWAFLKRILSELDPSSAVPERVRSALDVLGEGIIILDQSERIVLVNKSFEDKVGVNEIDLFGKHLTSLEWESAAKDKVLNSEKPPWTELFKTHSAPATRHMKLCTENNGVMSVDVNVAPVYGNKEVIQGVIVTVDDVTLLDKKNAELAHTVKRLKNSQEEIIRQNIELAELATRDPLTHTLNRRSLFEGFQALIKESQEQDTLVSCFILDIDHFKLVNDNYGHAVGDQVIKLVAQVLYDLSPEEALVGRYGGEEFVVVLPDYNEKQAAQLAEQIRLEIESNKQTFDGANPCITASLGVANLLEAYLSADELVDRADQALYKAKELGRNKVILYSNIESNVHDVIKVERKAQTRISPISKTDKPLIELPEQGFSTQLSDHSVIDIDGKLSIDAFDLMGSSSRIVVVDRLAQAIKLAKRKQKKLAVLTIFIDTIQTINNTVGYASAEKLRKIAYQRLNQIFRNSDSVLPERSQEKHFSLSRSGDSEFTAVLSDLDDSEVVTWITQRLFNDLKQQVEVDGSEIVMTANVGASFFPNDATTAEELMANSSLALEEANKLNERESFIMFNKDMSVFSKQQLKIEAQLYQAIEKQEFILYYQPIISLQTGRVEKLEALIRWKHITLGIVPPDSFMNIAENSGVIKKIGFWIVESAVNQLKKWHDLGFKHLQVSINLSAVQFNQPQLAKRIIEIVQKSGIATERVVFEITETALIKRFDRAFSEVSELSKAGFEIALDDFGTGYSSLDLLRKFPINWVKVDQSFMLEFPDDINDVSIVSGLIGLSHNLGMRVIAEGVEKESQIITLMNLGCDQMQGFYASRPLTVDQTNLYLKDSESEELIKEMKRINNQQNNNWDRLSTINAVISEERASKIP